MQKLLMPGRARVLCALLFLPAFFALLALIPGISPDLHAAPKPGPEAEIEQALRQQLPSIFVLERWTRNVVKRTQKGPITLEQSSLAISASLKEPLYVDTGRREGGKTVIRVNIKKGEIIELEGISVVAQAPVMGLNQVQVMLKPVPQDKAGVQLSRFAAGTFIISDETPGVIADSHEGRSKHVAEVKPAQQQAPGSPPAPGVIQRLWSEFGADGEIWGRETYGAYRDTPVVLRNLKMANAQTLEGIIDRPNQGLSNAFILMGTDSSLTLRIQPAKPASKGTPANLYSVALEDKQLVVRRGPVIPLSPAESDTLRKRFVQEKTPWQFAGDMSDYAQLGNKLIDINSLEMVSDRWGNRPLAPVKNLPGRYWAMDSNYELSVAPFGAYRASVVHTDDPKQVSLNPLAGIREQTWVSSDLSHYVSLKQGDIWIGTLDWQAGTASTAQNLTNIGVLNNLDPIAWCEQQVFFFNPQGADKPILRIDTQTGELREMAETVALNHKAQGSPDGCFLFTSDGRMVHSAQGAKSDLYVVDLRSLDNFTLDASFDSRIYVGTQKQPPMAQAVMAQSWSGRGLFWSTWQLGWFDLVNRKRVNPHEFAEVAKELPYNIRPVDMAPIPGDRYVEVSYQGFRKPADGRSKQIRKRYRLDRLQGTAVSLPLHREANVPSINMGIVWVDENRYIYPRRKGGLDELGTWLYDVRSKKHTRLSRFYADQKIHAQNRAFTSADQAAWSTPLYLDAAYLVLADKNRILFSTTRGDLQELVSVSLDGKELARKPVPGGNISGGTHNRLRQLHPYEINLPFTRRERLGKPGTDPPSQ